MVENQGKCAKHSTKGDGGSKGQSVRKSLFSFFPSFFLHELLIAKNFALLDNYIL
jgi:hypothetical protein